MAKSGSITAPTGSDVNMRTLGDSTPPRYTLAGVVRAALQLATAAKTVIVNFGVRKAVILPTATNVATVTGATDVSFAGTLTKDDPSKPSSSWTFVAEGGSGSGVEAAIAEMLVPRTPTFSVESLTNAIDDKADDLEFEKPIVIYDQAEGVVRVYSVVTDSAASPHAAAVALAEDAQFVQSLDGGAAAQFGE